MNRIWMVDPRRNTDRLFGGPHFALFDRITEDRIRCKKTGDVFELGSVYSAWMETRNLAPIIRGET